MPVVTTCPECEAKLKFPDSANGKKVRCPKCQGIIALGNAAAKKSNSSTSIGTKKKSRSASTSADDFGYDDDDSIPIQKSASAAPRSSRRSHRDDFDDDYDDGYDDYDDRDEYRDDHEQEASGMSAGAIISIVVGILGVLGIIGGVILWMSNSDDSGSGNSSGGFVSRDGGARGGPDQEDPDPVEDMDDALDRLRKPNHTSKVRALNYIQKQPMDPKRQREVSQAVEPLLTDGSRDLRSLSMLVMVNWATTENVPKILEVMQVDHGQKLSPEQQSGLKALARLRDPRSLETVASYLEKFWASISIGEVIQKFGTMIEPNVLTRMHHPDASTRGRVANALKTLGTSQEKQFKQTFLALKSVTIETQKSAVAWLAKADVRDDMREEVIQGLKLHLKNDRGEIDRNAVEALERWALEKHVDIFTNILNDSDAKRLATREVERAMKMVSRYPTPAGVDALVRWLTNVFAYRNATSILERIPAKIAEPVVVKYMNEPDQTFRHRIMALLKFYRTKDEVLFDQVVKDINSADVKKREHAVKYLAKLPVTESRKKEISLLLNDMLKSTDEKVQKAAMEALQTWVTEANIEQILPFVADLDAKVGHKGDMKRLAIPMLAKLKDKRAVVPIAANLLNIFHQKEAQQALIELGPMAEEAVLTFLNNQNASYRRIGCQLLQHIGTEKSIKYLKRSIQKDPITSVKQQAAITLQVITKREEAKEKEKEKTEEGSDKDKKPDN